MKRSNYDKSQLIGYFITPLLMMLIWNYWIAYKFGIPEFGYWEMWACFNVIQMAFPSTTYVSILDDSER